MFVNIHVKSNNAEAFYKVTIVKKHAWIYYFSIDIV